MARVRIYRPGIGNADIADLRRLVVEAGVPEDKIQIVEEIGDPDHEFQDDVFLLVLTEEVCADEVVGAEIAKAPNGGRRAVCIWPHGAVEGEAPAAARNFAYSIIKWNGERLRAVLADDDFTCSERPDGEALSPTEEDHLLCE